MTEKQILKNKRKVVRVCVVLLLATVIFGTFQAFNTYKSNSDNKYKTTSFKTFYNRH